VDLRYTAAEEQFRAELRAWLAGNLPAEWQDPHFWGRLDEPERFAIRRQWEAGKARAGFAGIDWPTEYGGRGGTPGMKAIYDEEMAAAGAPATVNPLGLTFLGPTVMAIGTEQQKRDIIRPLLHNEVIWCQGFSEPDAGSDLAALKTRARDDGAAWVVSGQKVWTSNAVYGDMLFALVRTSAEENRHRGISMLLIDMHADGVDVRPLKQLSGSTDFGEVFLTDVRVPKANVLGEVGRGWDVAMLLLSFERGASAMGQYRGYRRELDAIVDRAHATTRYGRPAAADPTLRQRVAASVVEVECLRLHSLHVLTQVEQGVDLGAASSVTKLQWSETHQDIGELYADVAGLRSQVGDPQAVLGLDPLLLSFLWSRSETIWGGSSQVQRNIVAERVLGLPR
jgi:alkylation response protein AidB-like acyl-CoA dehydrogenase